MRAKGLNSWHVLACYLSLPFRTLLKTPRKKCHPPAMDPGPGVGMGVALALRGISYLGRPLKNQAPDFFHIVLCVAFKEVVLN